MPQRWMKRSLAHMQSKCEAHADIEGGARIAREIGTFPGHVVMSGSLPETSAKAGLQAAAA